MEGGLGAFSDLWEATHKGRVHFPYFFIEVKQFLDTVRQPKVAQVIIALPKELNVTFKLSQAQNILFSPCVFILSSVFIFLPRKKS